MKSLTGTDLPPTAGSGAAFTKWLNQKATKNGGSDLNEKSLGNDLLSQGAAPQVPSALATLTSGFGMLPGVPSPLQSPRDDFLKEVE